MKKKLRRALGKLHLWLGLALALYFAFLGLTGSLLVFGREVDQWREAEVLRVVPQGAPLPLSKVLEGFRERYPEQKVGYISYPRTPEGTYNIRQSETGWSQRYTYLSPYTGQIVGERTRGGTFYGFLCYLHFYLAMGQLGWSVNGWGAILLTLVLLSGLWIWWPTIRSQWRVRLSVRKGRGPRVLTHDLHNVFGVYPLGLMLAFTLTAIVFAFKEPSERIVYGLTGVQKEAPVKVALGTTPLPLDTLVEIADKATDGRIQRVNFPKKPTEPLVVRKEWENWNQTRDRVEIAVDPFTGKVLRIDDSRKWPLGRKLIQWAIPVHFGLIGGMATRVLWVLLGLVPVVLAVTGALQWWAKKTIKQKK
ncbi:MAG: PepSY domain-containing protein [Armatimonadetes bacterium]|nr:PepSY domain-containing protein [Armatimonadota bacterium]